MDGEPKDFAIDIQDTLKAYTDFQIEVSDAVKRSQERAAATLSAHLEPVQVDLRAFTSDWDAILVQWAKDQEAVRTAIHEQWAKQNEVFERAVHESAATWVKALADSQAALEHNLKAIADNWATTWAESQARLAKDLEGIGPRLRRALLRAGHIGRLGWTVTGEMTLPDVVSLSDMQPTEADAYMLAWYEEVDADLNVLQKDILIVKELEPFHTALSQCFAAYRRSEYAITISCLVAVLEGGIRNLGPREQFFNTKVQRMVKDRYDKAKEDNSRLFNVSIWMSLHAFVQWFYEQYGAAESGEGRMFRHGIQHGTQPPPNEKVEVLRLLHALNTIATLYEDRKAS
jgi:hypothetical protein